MTSSESVKPVAILHFAAPPVVGGVEEVIRAQTQAFASLNIPVTVITGVGEASAIQGIEELIKDPLFDTQNPEITAITAELAKGKIPVEFERVKNRIKDRLSTIVVNYPNLIVHNVMTVHVNFPLTVAVYELLDEGKIENCVAWCHDFSWTMTDYSHQLHDGYPWNLLRGFRSDVSYVVVSKRRQEELAKLLKCPVDKVKTIYNGVDVRNLLGLGDITLELSEKFGLMTSDLFILMPIRIVKSKNIEYAINIVKLLNDSGKDVRLVVTGPPDPHDKSSLEYYQMLRDLRKDLNIEDKICFVYESGPTPEIPRTIPVTVVGELIRLCDVMLIASHSEGFGMPVLEAGLAGKPVFCSDIPAAREIGGDNVMQFKTTDPEQTVARRIEECVINSPVLRHKRNVRKNYTWEHIVKRDLMPLLKS